MKGRQQNTFRIIGGEHRGRRLAFPPPGREAAQYGAIRPSPDRVRETVFNWLAPLVAGSRCLDLFAGSGAMGLEALSRGAAHCRFVDLNPAAIAAIKEHLGLLGLGGRADAQVGKAETVLGGAPEQPLDIVFLDPPYAAGLLGSCISRLDGQGWLAPGAAIYLEHRRGDPLPELPPGWQLARSKQAGEVAYHLARKATGTA